MATISDDLTTSPASAADGRPTTRRSHTTVVGLQWGDEGKGKIVDLLAPDFDAVVRYNGGANAGHSVQVGDKRYALHLIPSGILYPEKLNVLGNGVVIDVDQLVKEMDALAEQGVVIGENLRVSDRAHLVMPWHKLQDQLFEGMLTRDTGAKGAIGTTGRGIGPCYADKALRSTAIRVCDLLNPETLKVKVEQIARLKNALLQPLADELGQPFEAFEPAEVLERCAGYAKRLRAHVSDTAELLNDAIAEGRRLLFEGANATLLDVDHGTYPFVTSSSCSSAGAHTGAGVPGHRVQRIIGIVKAYQTRVGGGPMPTELDDATGDQIREQGREFGTTTGRPRRCGWLDLVALRYTARVTGATGIALMLLDVLAGVGPLKLCTGYKIDGKASQRFPADCTELERAEPVYETIEGFEGDLTTARRFEDLPEAARRYVERIEAFIGVPATIISVGPARDQTIWREPATC
ncbi:adenylosuccinate synthase [Mucisphaera sp.]|uniref:adenylosuccinate synthase n=1 Tax=Mucisphaera sp. TaxID=2913024 RepID=UPI003D0A0709